MAISVDFRHRDGSGSIGESSSDDIELIVNGTTDRATARLFALAFAPQVYNGLVQQSCDTDFVTDAQGGFFYATVRYGKYKPPEPGDQEFSFEIGSGSEKITHSIRTVQSKSAFGDSPAADLKGAINVTKDGVEGCEIASATMSWSEKHIFEPGKITPAYIQLLWNIRKAPVCEFAWRQFAAGEVRFDWVSGGGRKGENTELNFKFTASENFENLTIGDITGINKKGWEYLWIRYADDVDTESKSLIKKPVAVYVEQVYQVSDFNKLGIGP